MKIFAAVPNKYFWFRMLQVSGLSHLIGQHLGSLAHLSPGLLMAALSIFCSFMTELISNAGTVTVLLPVFAAIVSLILTQYICLS